MARCPGFSPGHTGGFHTGKSRCWKSGHLIHSRACSAPVEWYSLPLGYWCLLRSWWKPGTCSAENVTYLPITWGSQMLSCLSVDSRLSFWSLDVVFQAASSLKRYQWRCAQCSDLTATRHASTFTPATTHVHKTVTTLSFTQLSRLARKPLGGKRGLAGQWAVCSPQAPGPHWGAFHSLKSDGLTWEGDEIHAASPSPRCRGCWLGDLGWSPKTHVEEGLWGKERERETQWTEWKGLGHLPNLPSAGCGLANFVAFFFHEATQVPECFPGWMTGWSTVLRRTHETVTLAKGRGGGVRGRAPALHSGWSEFQFQPWHLPALQHWTIWVPSVSTLSKRCSSNSCTCYSCGNYGIITCKEVETRWQDKSGIKVFIASMPLSSLAVGDKLKNGYKSLLHTKCVCRIEWSRLFFLNCLCVRNCTDNKLCLTQLVCSFWLY